MAPGDRRKIANLPADEFLRRFLGHVLPDRFQRIRHYGLFANRGKGERLDRCRELLGARPVAAADERPRTAAEWIRTLLGVDLDRCPGCGEPLRCEPFDPRPISVRPASLDRVAPRDTS